MAVPMWGWARFWLPSGGTRKRAKYMRKELQPQVGPPSRPGAEFRAVQTSAWEAYSHRYASDISLKQAGKISVHEAWRAITAWSCPGWLCPF